MRLPHPWNVPFKLPHLPSFRRGDEGLQGPSNIASVSRWPGTPPGGAWRVTAVHMLKGLGDPRLPVERRADEEVLKARSGGVGAASPGARERVSRSWTPLRLTRNRVATCRLEPSRFSLVCTTRRRQSRAEGRRDSSVQVGLPLRLYRGCMPAPTVIRAPEARPRPPSPCPTVAPGGTLAAPRPGGPPGLCSPCQGCKHLMGNHNLRRRFEPCRD